MDLIESARQEQQPILGVETFLITDTTTEPLMDHILDLSAGTVPADTWSEARQFVAQRVDCGFVFEITV